MAVHLPFVLLVPATTRGFEVSLVTFGGLLMAGALASGLARRSVVSLSAMFILAGFALGHGGVGLLQFSAGSRFVIDLATIALIVILFRDGLEVESEMLQAHWHLPLRKLVLAMPLTAVIVAVFAKLITDLSWTESFLLGALLSPTDPVMSSSVVTNPRVPRLIRHSLNLESGMNDGLALPAVIALSAALQQHAGHFVWWRFLLENVSIGFAAGIAVALAASLVMPAARRDLTEGIPAHQRALYALGVAFLAYGVAVLTPHGNGLIAVYVAGIALGIRRPDVRGYFESQSGDLVEMVKLGVFVVFGSLLTAHGLFGDGWEAVGIVVVTLLVARPVAVFLSLIGTHTDFATRGFMAWFGPKGVATMTFALLVLGNGAANGSRIFNLAALVVFCSALAHGLSDTHGAEWIARRAEVAASAGQRPRDVDRSPTRSGSAAAGRR